MDGHGKHIAIGIVVQVVVRIQIRIEHMTRLRKQFVDTALAVIRAGGERWFASGVPLSGARHLFRAEIINGHRELGVRIVHKFHIVTASRFGGGILLGIGVVHLDEAHRLLADVDQALERLGRLERLRRWIWELLVVDEMECIYFI